MIIFANSRVSGKTTEAIKLASSTHSILIVPTEDVAKMVERMAREMNYPVNVASARRYFKSCYGHKTFRGNDRIVIDELDWVLREIFGCEVIMATTTGMTAELTIEEPKELDKH